MRKLKITEHISIELVSTKALPSGIVINACKAAGPLKNQP